MVNKQIIVIDDFEEVVETLQMFLGETFNPVKAFINPLEALEYCLENGDSIDYIICDINMPEMNGIVLFQKFREKFPEVPFCFFSGHADFEDELKSVRHLRIDGIISKPGFEIAEKIKSYFNVSE